MIVLFGAQVAAALGSIASPLLPPTDSMPPRLSQCLERAIVASAVDGLGLTGARLTVGPDYGRDARGAQDRTRAEYGVVARGVGGERYELRLVLVTDDGRAWRRYLDRDAGIGLYGASMTDAAHLLDAVTGEALGGVSVSECAGLLGRG